MRIVIFGAHGPTGRLLTRQSLTAGYDTVAVTRQPRAFPFGKAPVEVRDGRFVRKVGHVITTRDNPSLLSVSSRRTKRPRRSGRCAWPSRITRCG